MRDRIPTKTLPNGAVRYGVYDETGNLLRYEFIRAEDDPTEEGTPLNVSTLLKDSTAALFGLDQNAVPDDVFGFLGKFNKHWWKRTKLTEVLDTNKVSSTGEKVASGTSSSTVIRYSSEPPKVTREGLVFSNPKEVTITDGLSAARALAALAPCYFQTQYDNYANTYYLPPGSTSAQSTSSSTYGTVTYKNSGSIGIYVCRHGTNPDLDACKITGWFVRGETDYIWSENADEYPSDDIVDDYEYTYIGIPFDRLPAMPRFELGSYVGTGLYGASNPNTLAFGFRPSVICFLHADNYNGCPEHYFLVHGGATVGSNVCRWDDDKTVSWWTTSTSSASELQFNTSGHIYGYLAFG